MTEERTVSVMCSQTSAIAQWQCYSDSWKNIDCLSIPYGAQALRDSNLLAFILGVNEMYGKHRLLIRRDLRVLNFIVRRSRAATRGYGATVARVTPDHKVGSSNISGLISQLCVVCDNTASVSD